MNTKLFYGLLIVSFSLLLGSTIYELVDVSEKSYSIGSIQAENKSIQKEIAGLKVSLSQSAALNNFEDKILEQGFEQIGKLDYILVSSNGDIASR
ncbi:MAG TPA: hypothetical protein PKU93_01980 [Candidatus Pacearchaeota archaeon]|nr:hypothetical protein [Candidatus Pacearchaeota archaeon]